MGRSYFWRLTIVAAVAVLPALGLSSAADEAAQDDGDKEPKQALERLADGLKRGDIDGTMACYADTDDVVAIQSYGRQAKGAKELRKLYADTFKEVTFERVDLAELSVKRHGDVAWATCRFSADTARKAEQDRWRLEIRTSYVLQRTAGGWKIVLEQSTPLEDVPRVRRRD
jgi:ketosteroid isomerase-like protein